MKKTYFVLATIIAINTVNCFNVSATSNNIKSNLMIDKLVEAGYHKDTAEALSDDELKDVYNGIVEGKDISIVTSSTEVDNLSEIEAFLSSTENELIELGIDRKEIKETKKALYKLFEKKDSEIIEEYGFDKTEVKLLRKAKENAQKNKQKNSKKIKNQVNASGSISSSKLSYTQTVVNNSTKKKPNYRATLSYSWKKAYMLAPFKDEIVVGWGGSLNCKKYEGKASYRRYDDTLKWTGRGASTFKNMNTEVTPNAGIEFIFPQSVNTPTNNTKSNSGSASVTVYQTKKQGYETTLISRYCHKVLKLGGGISISASGPSVSISVGEAWDKSAQKKAVIGY